MSEKTQSDLFKDTEPVVYKSNNMVFIKRGDLVPPGTYLRFTQFKQTFATSILNIPIRNEEDCYYAPLPDADLPPVEEYGWNYTMERCLKGDVAVCMYHPLAHRIKAYIVCSSGQLYWAPVLAKKANGWDTSQLNNVVVTKDLTMARFAFINAR
jgi:hypothetical protein